MVIITGASRGIGKFLLESFLSKGDEVIGTFLNTTPEENKSNYFQLDISDYSQVESFVNSLEKRLNSITLINNAGITYDAYTHKGDPKKWKEVIDVNLIGSYNMVRAMLPFMRAQHYGRIINFSSVVAIKPTPGVSSYASSKSALWGLSKSVAIENAAFNITINSINLGYTELGMTKIIPEKFKESIIKQIPAGKLCEPMEVFNTVCFLQNTSYINGSSLDLSGGLI